MYCAAYCNISSYRTKELFERLKQEFKPTWYRDVIHVETEGVGEGADVFFFPYGVVVFWNVPKDRYQEFLDIALPTADGILEVREEDKFSFSYGDQPKVLRGEFTLPNRDPLTKVAFSHAMAQSAKLGIFEQTIQKTIDTTREIPVELAKHGKLPFSRKQIRKKIGKLFIDRSSINLRFDLLDEPEFFWDYDELEPLYAMASRYLDIEDRVMVLNQKLEVVYELFEMLGNELNHQHSSRLEWIIIWLIVIEVVVTLATDFLI